MNIMKQLQQLLDQFFAKFLYCKGFFIKYIQKIVFKASKHFPREDRVYKLNSKLSFTY